MPEWGSEFPESTSESFQGKDGKTIECHDESLMLAKLLADSICFLNTGEFDGEKTTCVFVNCNDVFAWGCADAESVRYDEIPNLYYSHKNDPKWGSTRWCCIRRNQKPQKPIERDMRASGAWDDVMESLPSNTRDAEVSQMVREFASAK